MARRLPITNSKGTLHLHISSEQPEAKELQSLVEAMRSTNTDHHYNDEPVFNPAVSRQQAKAMFAAASGHSTLDIPAKVGKDFTKGFKGNKGSVNALPAVKHRGKGAGERA